MMDNLTYKIIEKYKEYPCLWNSNLSIHKCRNRRKDAYDIISKDLNITS